MFYQVWWFELLPRRQTWLCLRSQLRSSGCEHHCFPAEPLRNKSGPAGILLQRGCLDPSSHCSCSLWMVYDPVWRLGCLENRCVGGKYCDSSPILLGFKQGSAQRRSPSNLTSKHLHSIIATHCSVYPLCIP